MPNPYHVPAGSSKGGQFAKAARESAGLLTTLSDKTDVGKFNRVNILRESGKLVVGYIQYIKTGNRLKINEILIHKQYRGFGISSEAVLNLMRITGTNILSKTVLTKDGVNLYKKLSKLGITVE